MICILDSSHERFPAMVIAAD